MKTYQSTQRAKLTNMVGSKLVDQRYQFAQNRAADRAGVGAGYFEPAGPAPDCSKPQVLGDPYTTQRGPGYQNNTSGWVHGAGEFGEGKPGFDKGNAWRRALKNG